VTRSPNFAIQSISAGEPSFSAIVIAPTFDERERICATLSVSVPRRSAS